MRNDSFNIAAATAAISGDDMATLPVCTQTLLTQHALCRSVDRSGRFIGATFYRRQETYATHWTLLAHGRYRPTVCIYTKRENPLPTTLILSSERLTAALTSSHTDTQSCRGCRLMHEEVPDDWPVQLSQAPTDGPDRTRRRSTFELVYIEDEKTSSATAQLIVRGGVAATPPSSLAACVVSRSTFGHVDEG
jgi:hypothetical protein